LLSYIMKEGECPFPPALRSDQNMNIVFLSGHKGSWELSGVFGGVARGDSARPFGISLLLELPFRNFQRTVRWDFLDGRSIYTNGKWTNLSV
jgi:hypothetical protein